MTKITHLLLTVFFIPLLTAAETKNVSCRMISFQSAADSDALLCVSTGASVACKINKFDISAAQKLTAQDNVLTFNDAKTNKFACKVTVPANVSQALLIFTSSANADGSNVWKAFLIEDSTKNYPNGGAFVVNLHSYNIRFVLGEHKIMLKPAQQYSVPMPKTRDNFNMSFVSFEFATKENRWLKASENQMRFTEGLRYLIIAYAEPKTGTPRVASFQDKAFEPVKVN